MKTVVGLFDTFPHAQNAAEALENAGILRDDISVVANNQSGHYDQYASSDSTAAAASDTALAAGAGATTGGVVGGITGLLMGVGLFMIPGFGPIAAAGWLVSALTGAGIGAVAGGMIGALTNVGVPHADAVTFNEGVKRGGTLLAIKAEDSEADEIARILSDHGAVDIDERGGQYRQEGVISTSTGGTNMETTDANAHVMRDDVAPDGAVINSGTTQETRERTVI